MFSLINKYAILIINWNSWDLLEKCLVALAEQSCQIFDVYVGDNNSDSSIPPGLLANYPKVSFIFFPENYGFAGGNNRLFTFASEYSWIVLLNPDAFPERDWFKNLLGATLQHPDFSFFSSRLLGVGTPTVLDGDGDAYHISGLALRSSKGQDIISCSGSREVFGPCAAAAMYRSEILKEVGGFDEDFFCYFEDVDLAFRLRLRGYKCWNVADAVVHHVGSATSGGRGSDFSVYFGHRNMVWTFVKNMPGYLFYLFLPLHLILNLFSIVVLSARGQGRVALLSKMDAVKGLGGMWRKRKAIQSTRQASCSEILRVMSKQLFSGRRLG